MIIAALALAGLAVPVLVIAAKRLPPLDGDPPSVRFDIIVPAHDEPSLGSTVENLDLAMDVLVPPLVGSIAAVALGLAHPGARFAAIPWLISLGFVIAYVLRGWMLSGVGARGLLDLVWAPIYMTWKIWLALTSPRQRSDVWVRTTREGTKAPDP
ncbi:MAG: hypothetical protein IPL19_19470 [Sandaracinaceae bacterium]|nr:hypothetical protein [Sandaracinaceae bacterium]